MCNDRDKKDFGCDQAAGKCVGNNWACPSGLPLPIGISDYRLASSEYYYVDKTLMIWFCLTRRFICCRRCFMSITGWHRSSLLMSMTLLTKPATDPTKDGYIFAGWYADNAYATVFDFDSTTVSEDTTIYALWSKKLAANKDSVSFPFPDVFFVIW